MRKLTRREKVGFALSIAGWTFWSLDILFGVLTAAYGLNFPFFEMNTLALISVAACFSSSKAIAGRTVLRPRDEPPDPKVTEKW